MNEVKKPRKPIISYYVAVMAVLLLFNFLLMPWAAERQVKEVGYETFMSMIDEKDVGQVEIDQPDNEIVFTDKAGESIYKTGMVNDPELTQRLYDAGAKFSSLIVEQTSPVITFLLSWILPIAIFIGIGQYMQKKLMNRAGGGADSMIFGMGKSNAKIYVKSSEGIRFSDVAGEDEAKENLSEIVDYLHNPGKYREIGASMPKGILLVGPPGTGKTMLAKAVAGESNVPFFSMSGSEFVEMFVGMGASKVRDLFKQAKEKAPCIVFIDEIDAIGQKRDGRAGGNDEREQTLNQLLTEMDGFESNNGVIILAATNRPESLDPALTRPGRFDRRVPVELPDLKGREEILKVHAKKVKLDESVDLSAIARMASGASGAELANIVNEAALRAVRENRNYVTQSDLELDPHRSGEESGRLPRDRPCACSGEAEQLCAGAEDHDRAPHFRSSRIYDAGGRGQSLSDEPGRTGEQDRHADRRKSGGGACIPLVLYRRFQRYRTGDKAGTFHDHPVRNEQGV